MQSVLRRWKYLAFCLILGMAGGYLAATRLSQKRFPYTSTVVCHSNKGGMHTFDTTDVMSLANFVKSRNALEMVKNELQLQEPLAVIDRAFAVDVPRGTSSIVVTATWSDPEVAEKMLNRLIEIFVEHVTITSNQAVEQLTTNYEVALGRAKEQLTQAQQELVDFANENNLIDVEFDLNRLQESISLIETQLGLARTGQTKILMEKSKNMSTALTSARGEVTALESLIIARRQEMQRIKALRKKYEELQSNARLALNNRQRLQEELASNRVSGAVSVFQPAMPSLEPVSSNALKLFVGGFGLMFSLLAFPVLGWDLRRKTNNSTEGMARELGLPLLATPQTSIRQLMHSPMLDDEYPRLLALRIQQSIAKPGHVLLFSSLSRDADTGSLLSKLAACFAERDERVLLVATDTRLEQSVGYKALLAKPANEPDEPVHGLSDYLTCAINEVDQVVTASTVPGVDCLLLGRQSLPREGLGTRRMTELLEKLRKRYTLVIIDGPPASQTVDLEMLAARADGIIFTSHGSRADFGHNMDAVRNLMELDAPILGVIG